MVKLTSEYRQIIGTVLSDYIQNIARLLTVYQKKASIHRLTVACLSLEYCQNIDILFIEHDQTIPRLSPGNHRTIVKQSVDYLQVIFRLSFGYCRTTLRQLPFYPQTMAR